MAAHWKHIDKSQMEAISRMLSHGDRLAFERLVKDYCSWKSPDKPDGACVFPSPGCLGMAKDILEKSFADLWKRGMIAPEGRRS